MIYLGLYLSDACFLIWFETRWTSWLSLFRNRMLLVANDTKHRHRVVASGNKFNKVNHLRFKSHAYDSIVLLFWLMELGESKLEWLQHLLKKKKKIIMRPFKTPTLWAWVQDIFFWVKMQIASSKFGLNSFKFFKFIFIQLSLLNFKFIRSKPST